MTPTHAELTRRWHRVVALVESLPEATATGEDHLSLEVRGKRFAWLLDDHHGDARLALHCKAPPGANQALTKAAPDRFHLPPYLARHGWVGMWLDLPAVDWEEVRALLTQGYRMTAPKRLAVQIDVRPTPRPRSDPGIGIEDDIVSHLEDEWEANRQARGGARAARVAEDIRADARREVEEEATSDPPGSGSP